MLQHAPLCDRDVIARLVAVVAEIARTDGPSMVAGCAAFSDLAALSDGAERMMLVVCASLANALAPRFASTSDSLLDAICRAFANASVVRALVNTVAGASRLLGRPPAVLSTSLPPRSEPADLLAKVDLVVAKLVADASPEILALVDGASTHEFSVAVVSAALYTLSIVFTAVHLKHEVRRLFLTR